MGDLESFSGADMGGESFDPAAFERFKEKMRRAAAQIKAIKKQEQKQKQSEDEIVKILLKFFKSGANSDILKLLLRLLNQNVPAVFLVYILIIMDKDIQKDLKINLSTSTIQTNDKEEQQSEINLPEQYIGDVVLPLKVKIILIKWIDLLFSSASEYPKKLLRTIQTKDGKITNTSSQLLAFCLRNFFNDEKIEANYDKLKQFSIFILTDIVKKLKTTPPKIEKTKQSKLKENNK